MFERSTEKARRAIFFARDEATAFGASYIETDHLLLGMLREDQSLAAHILYKSGADLYRIREMLAARPRKTHGAQKSGGRSLLRSARRFLGLFGFYRQ